MRKFKASHPFFDPPDKLKDKREKTLEVFGLDGLKADTIRIMTETFFKAGMDRLAHLLKMNTRGDLTKEDIMSMLEKGGDRK